MPTATTDVCLLWDSGLDATIALRLFMTRKRHWLRDFGATQHVQCEAYPLPSWPTMPERFIAATRSTGDRPCIFLTKAFWSCSSSALSPAGWRGRGWKAADSG